MLDVRTQDPSLLWTLEVIDLIPKNVLTKLPNTKKKVMCSNTVLSVFGYIFSKTKSKKKTKK